MAFTTHDDKPLPTRVSSLQAAWGKGLKYRGYCIIDDVYPSIEEVVEREIFPRHDIQDGQECFLGYCKDADIFVIGYDISYCAATDDEEYTCPTDDGSGSMAVWFTIDDRCRVTLTGQELLDDRFYDAMYNAVHAAGHTIIDLRLD